MIDHAEMRAETYRPAMAATTPGNEPYSGMSVEARGEADDGLILSIVEEACASTEARERGWSIHPRSGSAEMWIGLYNAQAATPQQGWKLHVSAGVAAAGEVLRRALPVLLAENASFKVAASVRLLGALNEGDGSRSQVGKFITVYPNDDAQAVRLAVVLDAATRGLSGPPIPSDRPLTPHSLVHYRYGGFDGRHLQTPVGEIVPAIAAPDGALVPDRRLQVYRAPDWAVDPFAAAGIATPLPAPRRTLSGRYAIVAVLHQSPRGTVYLTLDLRAARRCVVKRAQRDGTIERDGRDARDRLRHEADVLAHLAPLGLAPQPFDLFEEDGDLFLAMEDVEGRTLEEEVGLLVRDGRLPSSQTITAWGREIAATLAGIHEAGYAYRDLKSANVIVGTDGRLRLVDFELAHPLDAPERPYGFGTRGYMPPRQATDARPSVTDDVYALGALLYYMASGAEPSQAPDATRLLDRPVRLLNPGIDPALERTIERCLDPDPARRFPTMAAVGDALAEPVTGTIRPAPLRVLRGMASRLHYRRLAHRLGDTLCAAAQPAPDGHGYAWASTHAAGSGMLSRDLNTGSAGPVLALAETVMALNLPEHRHALAEGARWLTVAPSLPGAALPGLYVGEAGIGAALLRAGQALDDPALVTAAEERGRSIAALPYGSPDLFNGTAGRLRFHLLLWDETGAGEHLQAAVAAGERLLATAEDADGDGLCWRIPPGYDGLSGNAYVGYAHGAAGIADSLLDLFDATRDARYLAAAQGAARWLAGLAMPVLDDGSGLDWPPVPGAAGGGRFWCHGAAGVGRFFLHAAALDAIPDAADLAARAARTVARASRWAGPVQCHGLSGSIEYLLDMFQASGARAYLTEGRALGRLLEAFGQERGGQLVFPSESPVMVTPDYMVGYAGVAVCLLRLSEPERLPHQLSRRGFRHGRG